MPHSRSQNVAVAWTAVAAKNMSASPRALSRTRASASKKRQAGTKIRHCRKAPKNGSPFRLAQASKRLCAVKKGKRLFFLLGSRLKSPWNNAQAPRTQSRKKLSEPTATPHSSFYLSCCEEILKSLFPGSELFFTKGKREGMPQIQNSRHTASER